MKKVATLVILLAELSVIKAHDVNKSHFIEGWGWNNFSSSTNSSKNSSKQNVMNLHSIVVNWVLVCEELCGAGFGGSQCGSSCDPRSFGVKNIKPVKFMPSNICPVLCDFNLGGKRCNCASSFSGKIASNRMNICDTLCQKFNLNIKGCSNCTAGNHFLPHEIEGDLATSTEAPKTTQTDMISSTDGTATQATTTTSKATAPSTTITGADPIDDQQSSEPDWSELCKGLCEIGDGGKMCNCDSPPLIFKKNK